MHREVCPKKHTEHTRDRMKNWEDEAYVRSSGLWQMAVNDKLAQARFTRSLDVRSPKALFCDAVGDPSMLKFFTPPPGMGFVVKDLDGSSAKGVYVLPDGWGGVELLSGNRMGADDVVLALQAVSKAETVKEVGVRILVEEYVSAEVAGQPSVDYKFYMFGGKVGAINVIYNRGKDANCRVWLDEDWNRVDDFGCFGTRIGSATPLCVMPPKPVHLEELVRAAKTLGEGLGIFYRVDLFVDGGTGQAMLGEFTPWPNGGRNHCKAVADPSLETGYDACGMGREWSVPLELGVPDGMERLFYEGGKGAEKPAWVEDFMDMSVKERCEAIM
jgi:hypothetical protein